MASSKSAGSSGDPEGVFRSMVEYFRKRNVNNLVHSRFFYDKDKNKDEKRFFKRLKKNLKSCD